LARSEHKKDASAFVFVVMSYFFGANELDTHKETGLERDEIQAEQTARPGPKSCQYRLLEK
jgi:hypothetical protein